MDVIQFFKDYGTYLCAGLVVLFDILLLIVKRRPKTLDDFFAACKEVLLKVPDLVSVVEVPGNGSTKKISVIKVALSYLSKKLGRDLSDKENVIFSDMVSDYIETILSTPTKKGEN